MFNVIDSSSMKIF